jgi:dynein heavy chain
LDPSVPVVADEVLNSLRSHYNRLTYQALSNCTRHSLNTIKTRVFSRGSNNNLINMIVDNQKQKQQPFFEVDVQLSVPSVRLSPSLDDVQRAINRAAVR